MTNGVFILLVLWTFGNLVWTIIAAWLRGWTMTNGMFILLVLWTFGNLVWTIIAAWLIHELGELVKHSMDE
jgi:hypothetical protein